MFHRLTKPSFNLLRNLFTQQSQSIDKIVFLLNLAYLLNMSLREVVNYIPRARNIHEGAGTGMPQLTIQIDVPAYIPTKNRHTEIIKSIKTGYNNIRLKALLIMKYEATI